MIDQLPQLVMPGAVHMDRDRRLCTEVGQSVDGVRIGRRMADGAHLALNAAPRLRPLLSQAEYDLAHDAMMDAE